MDIPDWVINSLPAFGIVCAATSFCYLYIMRRNWLDAYAVFYGLAIADFIFGFSLIYAGFHGILVSVNSDIGDTMKPISCISVAFHVSAWIYCDVVNMLLIMILCIDQLVSVIWSKQHNDLSSYYLKMPLLVILLFLSLIVLFPAWHYAISTSTTSSLRVSAMCHMADIVYDWFYKLELQARRWVPFSGLAVLCLTSCILLIFQCRMNWDYKWTDDNQYAQQKFFFVLIRCLLTVISVHLPSIVNNMLMPKFPEQPHSVSLAALATKKTEYLIRFTQGISYGMIQPAVALYILPRYFEAANIFWNKYAHNTRRNWQSAEDPPEVKHDNVSDPIFGSWHSTGGNIIGEAGIPNEFNADQQRSISFYYNEMEMQ